jgi:hypothetical protein
MRSHDPAQFGGNSPSARFWENFDVPTRWAVASSRPARFLLCDPHRLGGQLEDFNDDSARWLDARVGRTGELELELGVLIAAASDWTEDEMELDDLVSGLVDSGLVQLSIG